MNELVGPAIDCLIVKTQFSPNKHTNSIVNIDAGKLNDDTLSDKM